MVALTTYPSPGMILQVVGDFLKRPAARFIPCTVCCAMTLGLDKCHPCAWGRYIAHFLKGFFLNLRIDVYAKKNALAMLENWMSEPATGTILHEISGWNPGEHKK